MILVRLIVSWQSYFMGFSSSDLFCELCEAFEVPTSVLFGPQFSPRVSASDWGCLSFSGHSSDGGFSVSVNLFVNEPMDWAVLKVLVSEEPSGKVVKSVSLANQPNVSGVACGKLTPCDLDEIWDEILVRFSKVPDGRSRATHGSGKNAVYFVYGSDRVFLRNDWFGLRDFIGFDPIPGKFEPSEKEVEPKRKRGRPKKVPAPFVPYYQYQ